MAGLPSAWATSSAASMAGATFRQTSTRAPLARCPGLGAASGCRHRAVTGSPARLSAGPEPLDGPASLHLEGAEAVAADHLVVDGGDLNAYATGSTRCRGVVSQPPVQARVVAAEARPVVSVGIESFDAKCAHDLEVSQRARAAGPTADPDIIFRTPLGRTVAGRAPGCPPLRQACGVPRLRSRCPLFMLWTASSRP